MEITEKEFAKVAANIKEQIEPDVSVFLYMAISLNLDSTTSKPVKEIVFKCALERFCKDISSTVKYAIPMALLEIHKEREKKGKE